MNLITKSVYLFARMRNGALAVLVACAALAPAMAVANTEIDIEWPCIQGYVPEVAIAVVWPEPIEEDVIGSWLKDKQVKKVVNELGQLEELSEAAQDRIQTFAESIPEDKRIDVYNKVADGVVYRFNQRRSDYFKGIRKFTRQQIAMSQQVQSHLNELVALEGKTDADSVKRMSEIRETTAWQQRIFDRRESAIRLLCEAPVDLETVMGDILRDLAQYLP